MIIPKRPECSSTNISLLCKVWLNFTNGTAELDSDALSRFGPAMPEKKHSIAGSW
jgi:hypothetical protein